ncbi:DUF2510 domain-containing protein [Ornithinimicrobium sp. W1679]|uniref:DUF2510 domain-containing protein n=1 Tax=Ornithinimicrobium sp. W1679 TaxID=3418770 RepID=UPI003CF21BAD
MGELAEEYEEIEGKLRFLKGTTPDVSRRTPGALRATTRDDQRRLVGQAEFLPKEDDGMEGWTLASDDVFETDADPPDAFDAVPWPLAVGLLGLGVVGAIVGARKEAVEEPDQQARVIEAVGATLPPAGWYSVASDLDELRYWDGSAWTGEYARVQDASAAAADWYADPTAPASRLRYWDGSSWTEHVQPTNVPADWYPDPSDPSSLRWWDGTAWTPHVAPASDDGRVAEQQVARGVTQDRIHMSRVEWEAHVRAWVAAGALEQSLWLRIAHAHITDADQRTLETQRQMQTLTPAESAVRLQSIVQENPTFTQQVAVDQLLTFLTKENGLGEPRQRMLREWR